MHLGLALTLALGVSSAQRRFVGAAQRRFVGAHVAVVSAGLAHAAGAVDLANGQMLFTQKCAACHAGGAGWAGGGSLSSKDLERNGYAQIEGMVGLLSKGKGMMPAFGPTAPPFARFDDAQLGDVAAYVLAQAATGWAK
ncbi:hypothetical protein T492DRAFT_915598 [Pavlovales sp. CCMP2436]|nr:hypothetical protein T492DRAFT_915598 [Pavlovales sp. CCMP2436]